MSTLLNDSSVQLFLLMLSQATLWLALGWLVGRAVSRRRPALRYALASVTVAGALLLPAWTLAMQWLIPESSMLTISLGSVGSTKAAVAEARGVSDEATGAEREPRTLREADFPDEATDGIVAQSPATLPAEGAVAPAPSGYVDEAVLPLQPLGQASGSWTTGQIVVLGFCVVWVLGVVVRMARGAVGLLRLRRILRDALPFPEPLLTASQRDILSGAGLSSALYVSPAVTTPMLTGWSRPRIVIPAALVPILSARQLTDVLRHETAHALRRDHWLLLLQWLAGTVYWLHPLVHLVNRQLHDACDDLCDNAVLQQGDAADYAETLLLVAELPRLRPAQIPGVGMLRPGALETRVAALLDERRSLATRIPRLFLIAGCAASLTLGTLCGALRVVRIEAEEESDANSALAEFENAVPDVNGVPVSGMVVDEQGRPVAARLRMVGPYLAHTEGNANARGVFSLRFPSASTQGASVLAEAPDGRLGMERIESHHGAKKLRVVVKPPQQVRVHVQDKAGQPVAEAVVDNAGSLLPLSARTDAEGNATLKLPDNVSVQCITALKGGQGFDYWVPMIEDPQRFYEAAPSKINETVLLTLPGAGPERVVRITDTNGAPLAGVRFQPQGYRVAGRPDDSRSTPSMNIVTDERGIGRIDWLPQSDSANWSVTVYDLKYFFVPYNTRLVAVGPNAACELKLELNPVVYGEVKDAQGKPAVGALVRGQGFIIDSVPQHMERKYARTDAEGRFEMHVAPHAQLSFDVLDDDRAETALAHLTTTANVRQGPVKLQVVKIGTLIHGVITAGPGKKPYPANGYGTVQIMRFSNKGSTHGRSCELDEQGRYQLRVGPGEYGLTFPGDESADGPLTIPVVVKDEPELKFDRHVTAIPDTRVRIVTGTVFDSNDRPQSSAVVYRIGQSRGARADDRGRFSLPRPQAGRLNLLARSSDGKLAGTLTTDDLDQPLEIEVAPAGGFQCRVVNEAGEPVPNAFVQVQLSFDVPGIDQILAERRTTDAAGMFRVDGIPVGVSVECWAERRMQFGPGEILRFQIDRVGRITATDLLLPRKPQ